MRYFVRHRSSRGAIICASIPNNVPYICEYQYSSDLFKPVDVFLSSKGYQVISNISTANNTEQTAPKPHTLGDAFKSLPSALQRLCGTIISP
jgi:hypothetical protein